MTWTSVVGSSNSSGGGGDRIEKKQSTQKNEITILILLILLICVYILMLNTDDAAARSSISRHGGIQHQWQRITNGYRFNVNDLPLKIMLINGKKLILNTLMLALENINSIFDFPFFHYIPINEEDYMDTVGYDGSNAVEICLKYRCKIYVTLVNNTHNHGSFEHGSEHDVLAHASLPMSSGIMNVCLDYQNVNMFKRKNFLISVLIHELGHSLGLMDLTENIDDESIMCAVNIARKPLPRGMNNTFDKESLKLLYTHGGT